MQIDKTRTAHAAHLHILFLFTYKTPFLLHIMYLYNFGQNACGSRNGMGGAFPL